MSRFIFLTLLLAFTTVTSPAQDIEKIGVPGLEKILSSSEDVLHVVNFWATWCPPCVTELPYFEKLSRELQGKEVKFILISLDFPSQVESSLIPFLRKNNITTENEENIRIYY